MQIIRIKPTQTAYLQITREIRFKVFVEEQNVPTDIEYDEFEETSHHYLLLEDGVGAATCRWRLLDDVLPFGKSVYLHSQEKVLGFYEKLGFMAQGERFEEAGIPHFKMYFNA